MPPMEGHLPADTLGCWRCGAAIVDEPLPLSRTAECRQCRAELHVCLMCEFYDPAKANACREPIAEPVADKTRANFCGYFKARPGAGPATAPPQADPRAALDALFAGPAGDAPDEPSEAARRRLDELFR